MLRRIDEESSAEFMKVVALQRIGLQGFPGLGANLELSEALRLDAIHAVKEYGRYSMPWMKWPTKEEDEQAQKTRMAAEAQELIRAWIKRFEPENAGAPRVEP